MLQPKRLVFDALRHVEIARSQQELYNKKKEEAKANNTHKEDTTDYAQNTLMPYLGSE